MKKIIIVLLALMLTLSMSGCSKKDEVIKIAHKDYTEQRITGQILSVYLESKGFEIPFLTTYRVSEAFAVTGMMRYSADFISIEEDISDIDEKFMLNRFGLIGGLSLDLGPFYFRPEFGLEMATPKYGSFGAAPIFAIGIGLEF